MLVGGVVYMGWQRWAGILYRYRAGEWSHTQYAQSHTLETETHPCVCVVYIYELSLVTPTCRIVAADILDMDRFRQPELFHLWRYV